MNLFSMVNDSLWFIAHKSFYLILFSFALFKSVNFLFFLPWLVSLSVISGALLIALTYMGEDIIDCWTNQHILMDLSCQCNIINILLFKQHANIIFFKAPCQLVSLTGNDDHWFLDSILWLWQDFNLKWLYASLILSYMFDCGAGGVTMEQFLELVHLEKRHDMRGWWTQKEWVIQSSMLYNSYEPVTIVCSLNML